MDEEQIDYEQIRFRVDKLLERRKQRSRFGLLMLNILVYVAFLVGAWFVIEPIIGDNGGSPILLLFYMGWGTSVVLHGLSFYLESDVIRRRVRERLIKREIEDEKERLLSYRLDKPKRGRLELGEDGELVEIVDEDDAKSKRSEESS